MLDAVREALQLVAEDGQVQAGAVYRDLVGAKLSDFVL